MKISQEQLADELEKFLKRLPVPCWNKTIFYGKEIVRLLRTGTIPNEQANEPRETKYWPFEVL